LAVDFSIGRILKNDLKNCTFFLSSDDIFVSIIGIVFHQERKMPPPTVTCCKCGELVLKAQTYAVEGGRACKKHEGVVDAAKAHQQKAVDDKEAKIRAEEDARIRRQQIREERDKKFLENAFKPNPSMVWASEHCWCCGRRSLTKQQFAQVQLIAMEKAKLDGINPIGWLSGDNTFSILLRDIVLKMGYEVVVDQIEMTDEQYAIYEKWKARFDHRVSKITQFTKEIQICADCQEHIGIKYVQPDINIPLKAMVMIGAVYAGSGAQEANIEAAKSLEVLGL
jgi:hypothetical protein